MGTLRSIAKGVRGAIGAFRQPLWVPPGHYYSPIASPADVRRAVTQTGTEVRGVELHEEAQRTLAKSLSACWGDVPTAQQAGWRYHPTNVMFGLSDAAVYHSILRTFRPRRLIEVGSGFSSAIALDTADRYLPELECTFIEPNPDRLLRLLAASDRGRSTLIDRRVQDVPLEIFDQLGAGDILFVDSSHVSKAGSDVNWLIFEVLPRLAEGVVVHFHDIFWPFEYPKVWLAQGRSWTESYLLRAFLSYNPAFRILLFNSWLWLAERALVQQALPQAADELPGGLWLRKDVAFTPSPLSGG